MLMRWTKKLETLKLRYKALGRDAVVEDYNFVQTVLLTAPTVDAVEVVRRKDCEHCYKATFSSTGYRCKVWGVYDKDCEVTPEHYCSYGERKDNG